LEQQGRISFKKRFQNLKMALKDIQMYSSFTLSRSFHREEAWFVCPAFLVVSITFSSVHKLATVEHE